MDGTLFLVSTPIGNLEDLTLRSLRVLKEASIIAAEDTRRTQKLCRHYGIDTQLSSYHDYNKEEKTPVLLNRLHEGANVALVSDAGTPLISDPGYYLVTRAIKENISVTAIPGPSAILAALTVSGLPTDAFVFIGFLPRKSGAKTRLLETLTQDPRTLILFEAPHRLNQTLEVLKKLFGTRKMILARELTKVHEEILRGTAEEICDVCRNRPVKGELTLVIEGKTKTRKSHSSEESQDPQEPRSACAP